MSDQHEQRKPEEIESDIKQHRERLDDTLGEIEKRFSPEKLVNSAFDYVRHGGANEFASNLTGTIKANPTPFLVTTIGLGWLFWSQRNGNQRSSSSNLPNRRYDPYATSTAGEAMAADDLTAGMPDSSQSASAAWTHTESHSSSHTPGRTDAAKEKARHMSHSVKDRAHNMSSGLHDRTSHFKEGSQNAMHGISERTQSAGQQTAHFIKEHPVMAGALGIAIGAAIGGLLPSTRTENERLGAIRDKAMDRASEEGERYAEQARTKVHEKAEQSRKSDSEATHQSGAGSHESTEKAESVSSVTETNDPVSPSATTPGSAKEATDQPNGQRPLSDSSLRRPGTDTPHSDENR